MRGDQGPLATIAPMGDSPQTPASPIEIWAANLGSLATTRLLGLEAEAGIGQCRHIPANGLDVQMTMDNAHA